MRAPALMVIGIAAVFAVTLECQAADDALRAAPQIAQRALVAESDLQKALRAGGVRLKSVEIQTLLLGATVYHQRPADGAVGVTYIGQDGRWRSRNRLSNGQMSNTAGIVVIANDTICFIGSTAAAARPGCPSANVRTRAVIRHGQEIGYYFLDDGTTALISAQTRRGNPENL